MAEMIPRTLDPQIEKDPVKREQLWGQISTMRHYIEHIEKNIMKGVLNKGDPMYPSSSEQDGMKLGNLKIKFEEIASWIREFHALSYALVIEWRTNFCNKWPKLNFTNIHCYVDKFFYCNYKIMLYYYIEKRRSK